MSTPWKPARRWVFAKRLGISVALFAAIAWPLAFTAGVTLVAPGGFRAAFHGSSLNLCRATPPDPAYPPGIYTFENNGAIWLLPQMRSWSSVTAGFRTSRTDIILPLWVIALASGIVGAAGARMCQPPRIGLCRNCDYDLSATPETRPCPECGVPRDAARRSSP